MESNNFPGRFAGGEVHGFRTMDDLDIPSIISEAKSRWLRPNEIHAILSNYTYFNIHVKPVNLPQSGTIVLFDRKMLRNFRKDGHNWKKKKDGKTVKEAHEHLKVGTEERIHVYYAHGQDNPNFVRRCYWLLDKALEHIVLVHYRQTQELQCSPVTPVNSNSGSELSDLSPSQLLSEETDSGAHSMYYMDMKQQLEPGHGLSLRSREMQLHEINTLEWDELLASNDLKDSSSPIGEGALCFQQHNQHDMINMDSNVNNFSASNLQGQMLPVGTVDHVIQTPAPHSNYPGSTVFQQMESNCNADDHNKVVAMGIAGDILDNVAKDDLQTQDSFGRWMNHVLTSSPDSVDNPAFYPSLSNSQGSYTSQVMANEAVALPQEIFCITDVSPSWAYPNEETKILVVGFFHEEYQHMAKSEVLCMCGEMFFPVEVVQVGVFRCLISPKVPGWVNFFLSMDGLKISQVLNFEVRQPVYNNINVIEDKSSWEEFSVQMRLAHLLFSSCKTLEILSGKVPANAHAEAKKFAHKTKNIANSWSYVIKLIENGKISSQEARHSLLEVTLRNKLREWLLERIADGSKISERDSKGQGVLHLCAILGYTWAVFLFSFSTLSLDFRDKFGWTSLHWAAYFGREKMVAALLSVGAKPNLVTDPTSEKPGGYTAAELASKNGYDGLAAYLSEKALIQQFTDMTLAGNASGSLEIAPDSAVDTGNLNADEVYLKDTLTAYRTAADAAARIQAAFREQSFKLRAKAVQFSSPEMEARNIIAAMKIQHAFRNYETRKQIAAAARIQYRFRTWKLRREFLYMRRQAIKLQSAFRAFQLRKQYRKILWSVGVLEKGVLRWRLKRKGLRGLQVETAQQAAEQKQESDTEEEFFQAGRKQAEERVEKAVVCVQAMFRSKQAQLEYRRMKIAHNQAELEYAESACS